MTQKKVAILQSNYIPWKGYFDLIASVDEFILFDDMQYTRRDWRNRNKIISPQGLKWLTVPVMVKGKYHQKIKETKIDGNKWANQHWQTLKQFYGKAPHAQEILELIYPYYNDCQFELLSELNEAMIRRICKYLGISTKITHSWDYEVIEGKTERLISLCDQAGGNEYISGPSARGYLEPEAFERANIGLSWFDYSGYPEYPQLGEEFEHGVSILDLLFQLGPNSANYMKFNEQ